MELKRVGHNLETKPPHIFFTHSSANGQLGCFHVVAILNSAAKNIEVHVPFQIRIYVHRWDCWIRSYGNSSFSF